MALYTIELRRYIESFSQYEDGLTLNEKIERGRTKLFDFNYPFYDASKKVEFETLFIKEFYFREIGFETIAHFKLNLETWLNINMVYWNQLLESENLKFEPFLNTIMDKVQNVEGNTDRSDTTDKTKDTTTNTDGTVHQDTKSDSTFSQDGTSNTTTKDDATTDKTGNKKNNGTDTENTNMFDRKLNSDTPDTRLQITTEDGKGIIEYASNIDEETNKGDRHLAKENTEDTTSNQKVDASGKSDNVSHLEGESSTTGLMDGTSNEKFTGNEIGKDKFKSDILTKQDLNAHYVGKIGNETYSEMLTKYRSTFERYYRDIYKEMNAELFMLVY